MKRNNLILLALIAATAVFLAGCGFLSAPTTGTVVMSLSPRLVAQTIEPNLGMDVSYYDVFGDGPGDASFQDLGVAGTTVVRASLIPGEWTITVKAYNSDTPVPTQIGEGSEIVTIIAGQVAMASVSVDPLQGQGTLLIGVSWPSGVLTSPTVEASLTPAGTTYAPSMHDIAFTSVTDGANYSNAAVDTGYYTLSLRLLDHGTTVVWGTVEAVRIIKDQTSEKNFLLEEDVNRGGLELIIVEALDNPIEITFDVANDTQIEESQTLTVNAVASAPVDTWAWYLQGQLQTESVPSINLSGLEVGFYWLNVMVTSGNVLSSATLEFEVVSAPSGGGGEGGGGGVYVIAQETYIGLAPAFREMGQTFTTIGAGLLVAVEVVAYQMGTTNLTIYAGEFVQSLHVQQVTGTGASAWHRFVLDQPVNLAASTEYSFKLDSVRLYQATDVYSGGRVFNQIWLDNYDATFRVEIDGS